MHKNFPLETLCKNKKTNDLKSIQCECHLIIWKIQRNTKTPQMGQRDGLSYYDIQKIGRMYECERSQPIFNAIAAAKPIIR